MQQAGTAGLLTIDLAAIRNNWTLIGEQVGNATEVAAVVKANAYGLGAEAVTRALLLQGCRSFFVASLDEAEQIAPVLHDAAVENTAIYVFGGYRCPDDFHRFVDNAFIPVLYTAQQIRAWGEQCAQISRRLPSVIKIDTGMHRLGLTTDEFASVLASPKVLQQCSPVMLMSHLACADEPEHPLNQQQLEQFRQSANQFRSLFPDARLSLSNSFGVFLNPDYHFDMVRPGISLYGGNPTPGTKNPMRPVVTLKLPIAQIKQITGPATVGYGATFHIPEGETKTIAIVLGGYADGVFRHLSNVGCGELNGFSVQLIGRVSMDSIIFDVSNVDENQIKNAKEIVVIGSEYTIESMAADAGTISYEVLTRLGKRYQRLYL